MRAEDLVGPVVIHDEGTIQYANEEFAMLVAIGTREDLVGKSLTQFVRDEQRELLTVQFEQVGTGSVATGTQVTLERADGTDRNVIAVSSAVEWNGESVLNTSFIDITESELAVSLRENAMHEAPIGISISDPERADNPLVYVNDGFISITGYDREDVIGRNCRFLQGEATRAEQVAKLRRAIDNERQETVELRNYRQDGSMFWNRITITPVTDEDGKLTHFLGFQEDISASKVYEREKSLFEKHAEVSDQVMYVTDSEGIIEYVNPAFERMTGYTAQKALGGTPDFLRARDVTQQFYEESPIETGDTHERELTNQTLTGELYRVRQTIVPIVDDRDEISHYTVIERNVTDERLTNQILSVLDRVLRHNVRTAVNVIEGYAEFLEDQLDDQKQRTATESIQKRSKDLREISDKITSIRTLLDNETETTPLKLDHIDQIVERCRREFPDAQITVTIEHEAVEKAAIAKGTVFQLALETAIESAIEQTASKQPVVEIEVSVSEHSNTAIVTVSDNGDPIPEVEWRVIESGTETPLEHTDGIGIWLVYWSIIALGGTIEHGESELGGTKLTFEVPLATDRQSSEKQID